MMLGARTGAWAESGYTTKDYVQNGLYAHFDAIDNAGHGLHDGAATRWVDLSGNGRDLDTVTGAPTWESDALYIHDGDAIKDSQSATHYAALKALLDEASTDNAVTVELGWQGDFDAPKRGGVVWIGTMTREWANGSKGSFSVAYETMFAGLPNACTSSNGAYSKLAAYAVYERGVTYAAAGRFAYNTAINRYDSFGFRDGEEKSKSSAGIGYFMGIYAIEYTKVGFGGALVSYAKFIGRIRWARLYSRALTDDELLKNYEIDKARFNLP